jgi:ribonuclease III
MSKTPPKEPLSALEARIAHHFKDESLLVRALTHVSAIPPDMGRAATYQRLEFLGDRVLGLAICDLLIAAYPAADEGELSRRLAELVRKESCAAIAVLWQVGPHMRLGAGEAQSGGRRNKAILADMCEALIGAVFLDGGFLAARSVVENAFGERLKASHTAPRDAKTALQEWAQGKALPMPAYQLIQRSGPDHAPQFHIEVSVEGFEPASGSGSSKRIAEQAAAQAFLVREQMIPAGSDHAG